MRLRTGLLAAGLLALLIAWFVQPRQTAKAAAFPRVNDGFQIGMNAASITDYGYDDLRPYAPGWEQASDLMEMQRMGATIIRVFVAFDQISPEATSARLGKFLDLAAQYNVSAIVSLVDDYWSGHSPQGTYPYYTNSWNGIQLLEDSFFSGGYQGAYKNFVQTLVTENRNRSNIYAWELGNELKDDGNPGALISFMQDMSGYIKALDSNHLVASGLLDAHHPGLTPDQIYPYLPNVDVITIHTTVGGREGVPDIQWAAANGKLPFVEEIGMPGTGDRSASYASEIAYWRSLGARAFMQWGFIARRLSDNGDGDGSGGMDTIWHTDYEQLVRVFQNTLGVQPTPTPLATRTPIVVPTLLPTATLPPGAVTVPVSDDRTSVSVTPGAVLGLTYEDSSYTWTNGFDTSVAQQIAPNQLRALSAGQTRVTSDGMPNCVPGIPCSRSVRHVEFTLIISPAGSSAGAPPATASASATPTHTATATATPTPAR
ncbi:MAG TPA: hypothetical protein VFS62_07600 [Chloroflexota bacterium]|nr:hypothetical protein [Chloroflexota bacterium]